MKIHMHDIEKDLNRIPELFLAVPYSKDYEYSSSCIQIATYCARLLQVSSHYP